MEEGLRELEAHLAKMRERDARLDKESIDDPDTERKNINLDLIELNDALLSLSKETVSSLAVASNKFLDMANDVMATEGRMHIIKDEAGLQRQVTVPNLENIEQPVLPTPSERPLQIYLPSSKFAISLHVLDKIGIPISNLGDDQSTELILPVKKGEDRPTFWIREADYFLMDPDTRNPETNVTSFSQVYNVPSPSFEDELAAMKRGAEKKSSAANDEESKRKKKKEKKDGEKKDKKKKHHHHSVPIPDGAAPAK